MAIACGNSFILKPSERDPGAATLLAQFWQQAGLPDGVFSVLNGDAGGGERPVDPQRTRRGELRGLHSDRPPRL
ncbi:MAG: aldehyde dehydrogenase family protein [Microthrixaceae bacterium]|nr:aldehyde dehydrogenase family protein [Microthrixaceae bacterium]